MLSISTSATTTTTTAAAAAARVSRLLLLLLLCCGVDQWLEQLVQVSHAFTTGGTDGSSGVHAHTCQVSLQLVKVCSSKTQYGSRRRTFSSNTRRKTETISCPHLPGQPAAGQGRRQE
jgi:hypothetical protein